MSHATSWPSCDPAVALLQSQAIRWLDDEAPNYSLVPSQFVIDEASLGDLDAAQAPTRIARWYSASAPRRPRRRSRGAVAGSAGR